MTPRPAAAWSCRFDGLPEIPAMLLRRLRPHQLEGIRFMLENITGAKSRGEPKGCILADSMGLVRRRTRTSLGAFDSM